MIYRHIKTGNLYRLLAHAIDCTNERDGTPVNVYTPLDDAHTIYVRAEAEFAEKFEPVAEAMQMRAAGMGWCPACEEWRYELPEGYCSACANHTLKGEPE